MSRPLHGSQLYHALGFLPEFGGSLPTSSSVNEITEEIVEVMVASKNGEEGNSDKP